MNPFSHGETLKVLVESKYDPSIGFQFPSKIGGADGENSRLVSCFQSKNKWRD
jgi:hypothetical protein